MGDLIFLIAFIAFVIVPVWAIGAALEAACERRANRNNKH